jgi:hypothetical protein
MGIRNLNPHLCNSAILRTTKSIAELRNKKSCRTVIADLQNMTSAIPQFRNFPQSPASPLLSCPFSSAQDGFKRQQKIFFESSVSLETENLP